MYLKPYRIFNLRIRVPKHFQRVEADLFSRCLKHLNDPSKIKYFIYYKEFLVRLSLPKEIWKMYLGKQKHFATVRLSPMFRNNLAIAGKKIMSRTFKLLFIFVFLSQNALFKVTFCNKGPCIALQWDPVKILRSWDSFV